MSKDTYNGREIRYWSNGYGNYLEQWGGPERSIEFYLWDSVDALNYAISHHTVCIWYAKGTQRPSIKQQ